MGVAKVSWDVEPETTCLGSNAYDTAISVEQNHDMIVLVLKSRSLVKLVQRLPEGIIRPLGTDFEPLSILYRSYSISGFRLQVWTILNLLVIFQGLLSESGFEVLDFAAEFLGRIFSSQLRLIAILVYRTLTIWFLWASACSNILKC